MKRGYTQDAINIKIGSKSPHVYFADVVSQCNGGEHKYGAIESMSRLEESLAANCVPMSALTMTTADFPEFLRERRRLMAMKIKAYNFSL